MKKILLSIIYFLACILTIQAQTLYGTTTRGGDPGAEGTINKFIPATNNLTVSQSLESFAANPEFTNFIQASDGKLYGMTSSGGSKNYGKIFSFDPSSSTYTKLMDFDNTNGALPSGSLVQASDGKLYGMTQFGGSTKSGVIFSFDPFSFTYTKLKDLDNTNGARPTGSLIQAGDGKLYGMTQSGGSTQDGAIFSFDLVSSTYTKLLDFDSTNGGNPSGSLMQANDGKLYGMTYAGGSSDSGVIFSFDPTTSTYTKLKDFNLTNGGHPYGSLMQANDGKLYGMTNDGGSNDEGVIFSFDPSNSIYTKLRDFVDTNGIHPFGSLIQASDGKLYGMTNKGAYNSAGVIFSFDATSYDYATLTVFSFITGAYPHGSLVQANDGKLYGMTNQGGNSGVGVIFSLDPSDSAYTAKDLGINESGSNPNGVMQASDGKLYGMTQLGGSNAAGVIFSFDLSSSTYTKLKDFDGTNGAYPFGNLVQVNDGKLYGMTHAGGSNDLGVIFSFDPSISTYTKLMDLDYTNGGAPNGSLIQGTDGKLYGMTDYGGSIGYGVIFSFDPSSSTYTKLMDFESTNSGAPYGNSLIQTSDGKLYGMTNGGGSNEYGVIFSLDPSSHAYTKLKDFDGTNGKYPFGDLLQTGDGKLYGTAYQGGSGYGVIFSFDPTSSTYTKLKDFDGINGANPVGNLMQASDGKLYGMTFGGGSSFGGVIFSFDPSTSTYTKLKDYNHSNGANPFLGCGFIEVKECITSTTYYRDADGDGYGNAAVTIQACTAPVGYVTNNTDCDDSKASVHPGATEICNGIDDDCNGSVDDGFADTDGDHLADCVDPDDDNDGVPDFEDCAPLDKENDKILICHKGNTLCVSQGAVAAHLKHGDTEGPCSSNPITSAGRGNTDINIAPAEYKLSAYPNPFAGTSTIKYELPFDSKVSIKVYDIMGRLITTLVDENKKAGTHTVVFKTGHFSRGSLYYRIIATSKDKQFEQTNKIIQLQ